MAWYGRCSAYLWDASSVRALPVSQNLCLLWLLRGWWLGLVPFRALGCCMRRAALYNASIAGTALPRSIAGPVCRREEFMYCAASASGACYCLGPLWAMHAGPQDVLPMQMACVRCCAQRALYLICLCACAARRRALEAARALRIAWPVLPRESRYIMQTLWLLRSPLCTESWHAGNAADRPMLQIGVRTQGRGVLAACVPI